MIFLVSNLLKISACSPKSPPTVFVWRETCPNNTNLPLIQAKYSISSLTSLYSQKEIFLRELVSNASDAISKRQFESLQGAAAGSFEGMISIAVDKKAKRLTIADNGIGLNDEDLKNTLGSIASSGTKAFLEQMEQSGEKSKSQSQLIGQFGVGFLFSVYGGRTC